MDLEPGSYKSYDGVNWEKQPPEPKDTLGRRFRRYVFSPGRLAAGAVFAWIAAYLNNHHHVSDTGFWWALFGWYVALLTLFTFNEIQRRAGGKDMMEK